MEIKRVLPCWEATKYRFAHVNGKNLSMALQSFCWTLDFFSVSLSYTYPIGLLGHGIGPSQGRYLHTEQHKHRINTYTYNRVLSGIRTHYLSLRTSEDSSCLRPRGHCDGQNGKNSHQINDARITGRLIQVKI
jgi:hypothetical protein